MKRLPFCLLLGSLALAPACAGESPSNGNDTIDAGTDEGPVDAAPVDEWEEALEDRDVDYNAALRKAALRLTGDLPTLDEVDSVSGAGDESAQKAAYEVLIADYLDRPAFARQAFRWWQDTLRLGDNASFDQAAAFAAQVTFENRPYTDLLTATTGQCGSFDEETATFTPADCANGAPVQAGLLTHPAAMEQYFGNLAFRRVKWVQETFACTQFPAEVSAEPIDVGGLAPYTGTFPFDSISGLDTGRINFKDVSAVICANCHGNMNHLAPLFAYFDEAGQYNAEIVVPTPLEGSPPAELSDYLVPGEVFAWRYGGPETPDLGALGQVMSDDPAVAECAIARVWNWALGKGDIVDSLREVPSDIIAEQVAAFEAGEYKFKDAIFDVFTSEDFVRF